MRINARLVRLVREKVSALVESVRRFRRQVPRDTANLPPLPVLRSGGLLVDISNREELYRAMEEEDRLP